MTGISLPACNLLQIFEAVPRRCLVPAQYSAQASYFKHFQPMLLCAKVELGVKKGFV